MGYPKTAHTTAAWNRVLINALDRAAGEGHGLYPRRNFEMKGFGGEEQVEWRVAPEQPHLIVALDGERILIGHVKSRFEGQLTELLGRAAPVSEERLAQEIALMVGKADVREELDRLIAHIAQARGLLADARADNPMGRKFDFLCQEFNREANTLCSKSADIELTRIGIDLKGAIERMREQVQNVE